MLLSPPPKKRANNLTYELQVNPTTSGGVGTVAITATVGQRA